MTKQGDAGAQNLTGIWNGLYTYANGRSTAFVATLIDAGGSLSGTTHEPSTQGASPGLALFATLVGSRSVSAVAFTKTYDQPDVFHGSAVFYEGALSGDGAEIEGRWTIRQNWSGKFLMIRSPGKEVKAEREVYERVR